MNQCTQFRDGRLENFMREEGEGGQSTTKKLRKGKLNETNLMHVKGVVSWQSSSF